MKHEKHSKDVRLQQFESLLNILGGRLKRIEFDHKFKSLKGKRLNTLSLSNALKSYM